MLIGLNSISLIYAIETTDYSANILGALGIIIAIIGAVFSLRSHLDNFIFSKRYDQLKHRGNGNLIILRICGGILSFLICSAIVAAALLLAIFIWERFNFDYFIALILAVDTSVLTIFSLLIFHYTHKVNFKISEERSSLLNAVLYLKNGVDIQCGFKRIHDLFNNRFIPVELKDGNKIKIQTQDISSVFIFAAPEMDELIKNLNPEEGRKALILKIPLKKTRFNRIEIFKNASLCDQRPNFVTFISNKEKTNSKIIFVRPEKVEEFVPVKSV